jgi:hypothetical protein
MITGGTFITYKTYLIHFHEKCKRVDYLNELYLEEFQKEKYSQEQEKLKKDEKLEEFIKGAVNSAIEKNQKTYESTLNSLKKNVTLYNDVKKIMETKDNTEQ